MYENRACSLTRLVKYLNVADSKLIPSIEAVLREEWWKFHDVHGLMKAL